jgi:hypothetical protein
LESCAHDYKVCGYNSAIVIEECTTCGYEKEYEFNNYCLENGFPLIERSCDDLDEVSK